jgi:HAD superfamily hydrolase (TIGR01509 family)
MRIRAVIFDVDGLLVDSEMTWFQAAVEFMREQGKTWTEHDHHLHMGSAPAEWARYMREHFSLELSPQAIQAAVTNLVRQRYELGLPVLPGAIKAVRTAASVFEVALASGSPPELIRHVAGLTGLETVFKAMVSGSEVQQGKPAPDIYIEAARRLGVPPVECVGIEDSVNGILSVKAAGMFCIAVPTLAYPLPKDSLKAADRVLPSLEDFSLEVVQSLNPRKV